MVRNGLVMQCFKDLPGVFQRFATRHLQIYRFRSGLVSQHKELRSKTTSVSVYLLRRYGQVLVKVFDYFAKQVAIVIPLTAPSMRRTRCKRKVEVFALFNQFFS